MPCQYTPHLPTPPLDSPVVNPSGICQCGCGQMAPIAPKSYVSTEGFRIRKGEHGRWILNHDKRWLRPDIVYHLSDYDLGWIVGLYEGEGCISKSPKTRNSYKLTIGQNAPWIFYRLKSLVGGHIRLQVNRNYWWWELSGPAARGLVTLMEPHLSPRRQVQIQNARELVKVCRNV